MIPNTCCWILKENPLYGHSVVSVDPISDRYLAVIGLGEFRRRKMVQVLIQRFDILSRALPILVVDQASRIDVLFE